MSIVNCIECNKYVDTDFDDFDFETGKCMDCWEDKCENCPIEGTNRCKCGCPFLKGIER